MSKETKAKKVEKSLEDLKEKEIKAKKQESAKGGAISIGWGRYEDYGSHG
jgi:hypothetical protein